LAEAELATGSYPHEELKAVRDVAIRGSEIVRQLMIYAGNESDVLELVDVSKVRESMLGVLKVAVSRHTALVTNLGEDLPAVQARPAQLSQIVMNLVVNASEALGNQDGVVSVTTEHIVIDGAAAIAKGLPAGKYVRLEVSDTGCGMPHETQAKIFDPFFTTKFSGRGLGLAIAHGVIRSLHGAIQVVSEPGKGTTFQVLLPCAETGAKPEAGRVPLTESEPPSQPGTVLVVEDEEYLRLAVACMLRKSGFETLEAASGSAAIDVVRARGGEIDLILLDLTIPGSSSQQVVAEAELVAADKIKIILTSAFSEEVAKPMMDAPPVRGFVRKPFEFGNLLQTLRSVLFG
jgi:CheY-like chemotaxis protein